MYSIVRIHFLHLSYRAICQFPIAFCYNMTDRHARMSRPGGIVRNRNVALQAEARPRLTLPKNAVYVPQRQAQH